MPSATLLPAWTRQKRFVFFMMRKNSSSLTSPSPSRSASSIISWSSSSVIRSPSSLATRFKFWESSFSGTLHIQLFHFHHHPHQKSFSESLPFWAQNPGHALQPSILWNQLIQIHLYRTDQMPL